MLDWFVSTGPFGVLVVVVALGVIVFGAATGFGRKSKATVLLFLVLAFLPLILGLVGTMVGFATVDSVVNASPGSASPQELAHGRSQALQVTLLGGGATLLVLLFALGSLALADRDEQPA